MIMVAVVVSRRMYRMEGVGRCSTVFVFSTFYGSRHSGDCLCGRDKSRFLFGKKAVFLGIHEFFQNNTSEFLGVSWVFRNGLS